MEDTSEIGAPSTTSSPSDKHCQCSCGEAEYTVSGKPLMGFYCHCQTCQQFNQASHADVVVYYARDVSVPDQQKIAYKYFAKPPMVKRGACVACHKPALEYLELPLLPKLAIVPRANVTEPAQSSLPASSLHMFYHRRLSDSQDTLPKYSGYLVSMLMVMYHLFVAMWRQRKSAKVAKKSPA